MNFNMYQWLAALIPIVTLIVLLIVYRRGSAEAAAMGLLSSLLVGYPVFGAPADMIAIAIAKGLWNSLSIILVVFPALLIYEVSREAGGLSAIQAGMQNFTPDKVLQVLAIGWIFVSFLQGITGFGVPVAVGAPLLIGLGVRPLDAVLIALLGQAWGNTFGTLGIAWDGLVSQVDGGNLQVIHNTIFWSTATLGLLNIVFGFFIVRIAGGYAGIKRHSVTVLVLGVIQGLAQMWMAFLNPMLSNFFAATVGLVVIFGIGKLPFYQQAASLYPPPERKLAADQPDSRGLKPVMSMGQAFLPYLLLIGMAVIVLLNNNIKNYLGQWKMAPAFAGKVTQLGFATADISRYSPLAPFVHSGTFLFLAALAGYIWYRWRGYIPRDGLGRILANSLSKTIPSGIAVVGLMSMAKVMDDTGQTTMLAQGTTAMVGAAYPVFSPFIGMLGTFMTGSNLSSNILFGGFQEKVAVILHLDKAPILAVQTVGGAIGCLIAPSKVLLGTTNAGVLGQEGEVIRRLVPVALLSCGTLGILTFLMLLLGNH